MYFAVLEKNCTLSLLFFIVYNAKNNVFNINLICYTTIRICLKCCVLICLNVFHI